MQYFFKIIILAICLSFTSIAHATANTTLFMATGTTIADTGLLDYLTPLFKEDTGYTLIYNAVGTNEALTMGKNGDVSLVFTHSPKDEENFVDEGFGVKKFPVMYNDFIVIGPKKPIEKSHDVKIVFQNIFDKQLSFISRGDGSGTHFMEENVWNSLNINPSVNPQYIESGQGMGATLTMADEKEAYTLTDRGTWLKMSTDADISIESIMICENDISLFNQYSIIAVNPEKHPDTNIVAANVFIEWVLSDRVQELIGEFGVGRYGQALFMPNANDSK